MSRSTTYVLMSMRDFIVNRGKKIVVIVLTEGCWVLSGAKAFKLLWNKILLSVFLFIKKF